VLRPGRRVEQVEASLTHEGQTLVRATAWRLRRDDDLGVGAIAQPPPAGPETGRGGWAGLWRDEVAYHRALDWRIVEGEFAQLGPATVWSRLLFPLIAGEDVTPLERLLVMADAASGVSAALDWEKWLFVNVDLGIHLSRPPVGEWMSMAARTDIGPTGMGLCTSTLGDADGSVGVSTQTLLVTPR
jgi:hypothetical protein